MARVIARGVAATATRDGLPWVVLPVKSLSRAKSRLRGALEPQHRHALAHALCARALQAAGRSHGVGGVLVATDGDDVAGLAQHHGHGVVRDPPGAGLADVVDAALDELRRRSVSHALVLMADLPLVTPRSLDELVAQLGDDRLLIVPDRARRGTGALGLPLQPRIASCFGHADSLHRHVRRAREHGLRPHVLVQPQVARDVDHPRDLGVLRV